MKKLLVAAALLLSTSTAADALSIDYETVSGTRYSYPYGWDYSYDIGLFDDVLKVDIDIRLTGATVPSTTLSRWETGIESIWSTNRFDVPILFNVDWVTSAWDYSVNVIDTMGRWDMRNWYLIGSPPEQVAAHEYGHMLSLWDEYDGGATNPVTHLTGTGGLMETLSGGTLDYYYDPFFDWYEEHAPVNEPVPTPEPSTFLLLGAGLVAVMMRRKQVSFFNRKVA